MTCTASMRPFRPVKELEVRCELTAHHPGPHQATLRDYAWKGSSTSLQWMETDRRTFHGVFAPCTVTTCILPNHHRGDHS